MNARHVLLAASIVIALATSASHAQNQMWMRTNGPFGGKINALLAVDNTIFASTGALFRSTNGGNSWDPIGPFRKQNVYAFGPLSVRALASDSSGIIVATTSNQLFLSNDNGNRWRSIDLTETANGSCLAIAPNRTIFRNASDRLYRLTTRDVASSPVGPERVTTFAMDNHGIVYVVTMQNEVQRSTDNGDSWTIMSIGTAKVPAITNLTILPNGRMIAGTSSGPMWSLDSGATWQRDTSSIRERRINGALYRNEILYAGTVLFGAFRSNDDGATWDEITPGLDDPNVWALAMTVDGTLYAGTSSGIEASTDRGENWIHSSNGIFGMNILDVAVERNGHVFAATESGIFRSTNRGDEWAPVNYQLSDRNTSEIAIDSTGNLIALTRSIESPNNGAILYRSSDGGNSWNRVGEVSAFNRLYALTVAASGSLFIVRTRNNSIECDLLRSTNGGASWEEVIKGMQFSAMTVSSDRTLFFTTFSGEIYGTKSDGADWFRAKAQQGTERITTVGADAKGGVYATVTGNVWRSFDNGLSWAPKFTASAGGVALAVSRTGSIVVSTAGSMNFVTYSSDRGETWRFADSGLAGRTPLSLAFAPDGIVYAGTYEGMYRTTGALSSTQPERTTAAATRLEQPRPHPVSGIALLGYSLASSQQVRLSLFDMRGSEVAVLFDGVSTAGSHELTTDLARVPSGVYALRMISGSEVVIRRVVVE